MIFSLSGQPLSVGDEPAGTPVDPPPTGTSSLPVRITVGASGAAVLPVRVSVIAAALIDGGETVTDGGAGAAVWGLTVEIGGVDMSDSLAGEVTVEAEEGAARIADLKIGRASCRERVS